MIIVIKVINVIFLTIQTRFRSMGKHIMCGGAPWFTSMIISRRPGKLAWLANPGDVRLIVGLHAKAFLLSFAIFAPCILLFKSVSSTTLFYAIGFIPLLFILFETCTVVVPGLPVGVHFHMQLLCTSGFFVVFLLFYAG